MTSPADVRARRRPAGFTLLEVLVVLVILGVATGMVTASFPRRGGGMDLADATDGVAGALRLGRARSIAFDRAVSFAIDTDGRGYVLDGEHHSLPHGVLARMMGPGVIRFDPQGGGTGGAIAIGGDAGGGTIVRVDWLTGRVVVVERS